MSRLALGTVQFGLDYGIANRSGQISDAEAHKLIARAESCGMDTLDTAVGYGNSEQRLGEIGVAGWRIVSKLPSLPDNCEAGNWVADAAAGILQRLRLDRLYGLLLHRPGQLLEPRGEALFAALCRLREQGRVQKIGISIYEPAELDQLCDRYRFDLVQAPFNILDRRLLDSGWIARLAAAGTELHTRSAFLQGLLLMGAAERPQKFRRWSSLFAAWDAWLRDNRLTPLQACLRYSLSVPEIARVVVGVDSEAQLIELAEAAQGALPALPPDLRVTDVELLNPAKWPELN
jgi:aryl-alcohol dehydrogenase-like predicted oxidoreductase